MLCSSLSREPAAAKKKTNLKTVEMQHVNTQISPELAYGKKKKKKKKMEKNRSKSPETNQPRGKTD